MAKEKGQFEKVWLAGLHGLPERGTWAEREGCHRSKHRQATLDSITRSIGIITAIRGFEKLQ